MNGEEEIGLLGKLLRSGLGIAAVAIVAFIFGMRCAPVRTVPPTVITVTNTVDRLIDLSTVPTNCCPYLFTIEWPSCMPKSVQATICKPSDLDKLNIDDRFALEKNCEFGNRCTVKHYRYINKYEPTTAECLERIDELKSIISKLTPDGKLPVRSEIYVPVKRK